MYKMFKCTSNQTNSNLNNNTIALANTKKSDNMQCLS